jgi:hypothetical protein
VVADKCFPSVHVTCSHNPLLGPAVTVDKKPQIGRFGARVTIARTLHRLQQASADSGQAGSRPAHKKNFI